MFRNSYQRGLLTVFTANCYRPLALWRLNVKNGHIQLMTDPEIKAQVLDLTSLNVSTTFMVCPKNPKESLGIHLPFLVMIIKNLRKYFSFEVTILDESLVKRRFRVSNFQSNTSINTFCTSMPIGLTGGWNQIQFNLAEFTRRAYKLQFYEVVKVQINANIRVRRIYFSERLYADDELPREYKLFFPVKPIIRKPLKSVQDGNQEETRKSKDSLTKLKLSEEIVLAELRRSAEELKTSKSVGSTVTLEKAGSDENDAKTSSTTTIEGTLRSLSNESIKGNFIKSPGSSLLEEMRKSIERSKEGSPKQSLKSIFDTIVGHFEDVIVEKENENKRRENDMMLENMQIDVRRSSSKTSLTNSELSIIKEESMLDIEKERNKI